MAGDNKLSSEAAKDINHMEYGFSPQQEVKILAFSDTAADEDTVLGNTVLYDIKRDTINDSGRVLNQIPLSTSSIVSSSLNLSGIITAVSTSPVSYEANMGSTMTLVAISTYVFANYAAENYMLIIWDDGGGFYPKAPALAKRNGIAWDFNTPENDYLSLNELSIAFNDISRLSGRNFDVIGFDACNMGTIEALYDIRNYCSYAIASSDRQFGWPYSAITGYLTANPAASPLEFSKKTADLFEQAYADSSCDFFITGDPLRTVAVYKMQQLPAVITALDEFALRLMALEDNILLSISRLRSGLEKFGGRDNPAFSGIDLGDFARVVSGFSFDASRDLSSISQRLINAVSSFAVYRIQGESHPNYTGLCINFPPNRNNYDNYSNQEDEYEGEKKGNYENLNFSKTSKWDEFLDNYCSRSVYGPQSLFYVSSGPNPYNPNRDGFFKFFYLPENLATLKIRIYDIAGTRVRFLDKEPDETDRVSGIARWDGRDESGNFVSDGAYFFGIESDKGEKKGKITVLYR